MEPTIPTSFIPKRPVSSTAPEPTRSGHQATGLLSFLTIIIVVATVAGFGWVYVDEKQLTTKRDELTAQINKTREGLGTAFVLDIKRLSERIESAKIILDRHIVVSPIFAALEQSTLKTVQYKDFTYAFVGGETGQTVTVSLSGTARSYETLALQSDEFTKSYLIKNPVFSGLTIDEKTNRVDFDLEFSVSAADLSYEKFIASFPASTNVSAGVTSTSQ